LVLLLTWGPIMASTYTRFEHKGQFATGFPSVGPWTMFSKFVLEPNVKGVFGGAQILAVLTVLLVARHCQSKFVYFAKMSEPDFVVIDFPAFFRVDLSGSMAAPSI
jgi:hypothetical protein